MVKANCHFDYHHTIGKVDAAWILSRFHPHRTHFSSNRLRHFNPKDKTFRSASTIFVADSIRFQSLGPRDRCQASKSRFQAQGISLAMWHHPCSRHHPPTLIYFFFYTPLLSPAKDGAPHLLAWSCGTLGWRRRSPVPGRGFESRTESQFSDWRWEIIRKRGGGRFLSTLRGWFLLPVRGGGESVLVVFFLYCCIGTLDIVLPS
jgi:hypothetical protein